MSSNTAECVKECENMLHTDIMILTSRHFIFQIASDRTDKRLNFPRQNSEITKYMDAAWRLKEQTQNLRWKKAHFCIFSVTALIKCFLRAITMLFSLQISRSQQLKWSICRINDWNLFQHSSSIRAKGRDVP